MLFYFILISIISFYFFSLKVIFYDSLITYISEVIIKNLNFYTKKINKINQIIEIII